MPRTTSESSAWKDEGEQWHHYPPNANGTRLEHVTHYDDEQQRAQLAPTRHQAGRAVEHRDHVIAEAQRCTAAPKQ
jgi:hypothetical protein